jgi:hypothetical protein
MHRRPFMKYSSPETVRFSRNRYSYIKQNVQGGGTFIKSVLGLTAWVNHDNVMPSFPFPFLSSLPILLSILSSSVLSSFTFLAFSFPYLSFPCNFPILLSIIPSSRSFSLSFPLQFSYFF